MLLKRHLHACAFLVCALAVLASLGPADAASFEDVAIAAPKASKGDFTGKLLRPKGPGPFPAIVALHGCGGLLTKSGKVAAREADWAERFVEAGYVVLLADSFTARGMREICTAHERSITPEDRADDARAAGEWLAGQAFVDRSRMVVMGWSHGAMTTLWTIRPGFLGSPPLFKAAIAFYPGCRAILRKKDWHPAIPLSLLIGDADDWTEPGPCRDLAQREGFRFITYPGAYHGFDAPNTPIRVRKGLGAVRSGEAHVGTDPAARQAAIAEIMDTLSKTFAAAR